MTVYTGTYLYRGRGPVYVSPKTTPEKRRSLGNVGTLELNVTEKTETLPNYNTAGGGSAASDSQIQTVGFKLTTYTLDPKNIAIGLRGLVTSVTAAAVNAEAHTVYPGCMCLLSYLPDLSQTITVTRTTTTARANSTAYAVGDIVKVSTHIYVCKTAGTSAGSLPTMKTDGTDTTDGTVVWADTGTTTVTLSTDYILGLAGLVMTTTGVFKWSINGEPVTVTYTKNPHDVIEALTTSGLYYELLFDGINAVDSGSPFPAKAHNVLFKPTSGLGLIQESGYGNLTMEGTFELDTTVVGQGLSQYLWMKRPSAA